MLSNLLRYPAQHELEQATTLELPGLLHKASDFKCVHSGSFLVEGHPRVLREQIDLEVGRHGS